MMKLASNLKFEEAQIIKERLDILEDYQAKNTVVNPNIDDVDVFGMTSDETAAYVNFFKIRNEILSRVLLLRLKRFLKKLMKILWKKL